MIEFSSRRIKRLGWKKFTSYRPLLPSLVVLMSLSQWHNSWLLSNMTITIYYDITFGFEKETRFEGEEGNENSIRWWEFYNSIHYSLAVARTASLWRTKTSKKLPEDTVIWRHQFAHKYEYVRSISRDKYHLFFPCFK